jgi:2-methylcitrate dehydratase PrpD
LFKKEELTADRFFKGIVAGYETAYTLAASIQPLHKELGYHATGTCGTIGAAVAVAVARKGSLKDLINSFSTAVISTSGMLKVIEDGSELKSYNVGKASLMGYISSNLAFSGFEVPKNVLEGTNGFFKMFTGKEDIILANVLRKGTFAIQKVYFKPFAACRYCHPAIEASLNLTKHKDLEIENIEKIVLHTYYWAVTNHDHSEVNGITSARMSIPYSIALALVKGKAGISEYTTENISNKRILNVAKKVEVISDEEFTKIFPSKTIALIQIFLKNGDIIKEQVDFPKGEPENPLTKLEIENKFTELAKYGGKTQKQIDQIISYVWDLENNLDKLYELL